LTNHSKNKTFCSEFQLSSETAGSFQHISGYKSTAAYWINNAELYDYSAQHELNQNETAKLSKSHWRYGDRSHSSNCSYYMYNH